MARKDEFDFDIPDKKEKKEKPQREEKERKPLFGEGSFLGGLFKKSSSFDDEFSFEKEKKKNDEKSTKRLKWWHILLIVIGAIIIIAGIVVGILIGQINNKIPGGIGSIIGGGAGGEVGEEEDIPETNGVVSSIGTFLPKDTQEYILCEYTEYFSGETIVILQKPDDVRYNYKRYWVLISENGKPNYHFSDEFPENNTPEQVKKDLFDLLPAFGYTEERLALCDMHIYEPVKFTRVKISEVTLAENNNAIVKYRAGAVDGEMSEEFTLTGTYTMENNALSFAYTTFPEDENLLRVAEDLLDSATYKYYSLDNKWVNELTFGDDYKLTLVSPPEE